MTVESPIDSQDPWHDDVLDRAALGKVLEDHLINRFSAGNHEPLSLALDGRWGSGKSFFVERWTKQLLNNGRFVISFNAWQHDSAPEPSLALIGELRRQLRELGQQVISQQAAAEAIERKVKTLAASAKNAIKPVGKMIAMGLFKKLVGVSVDDLASALSEEEGHDPSPDSSQQIFDKAIDAYFDQMLTDHELHQASIAKFREDLASLANSISDAVNPGGNHIGPVIVIIDELDRCRPDFAVRLLEGIKHLFSVTNVCFVFATNLSQLTASIQVVYGANFSGREYLGRFFDRELSLPAASGSNFSKMLLQRGLPSRLMMGNHKVLGYELEDQQLEFWLALSRALNLTLRQQQQAFAILQTCCEAYHQDVPLPGVWLMFLSQIKAATPAVFDYLLESPGGVLRSPKFQEAFPEANWSDKKITNPWNRRSPQDEPGLISLLEAFFKYSKLPRHKAQHELYSSNTQFTDEIERYISTFNRMTTKTILETSYEVVSAAGMFSY
ncbi:KAP family P-loop NTPase fold protein [Alcaligenes faecalis]|uniref:KAP family P-loop NTPase fold protein n=1 Tax=Alcaligenes faecalis TaxID=511 RepID=UPI000AF18E47|nr:P-loop NTPase fold protein [Alcaligenes faecalis]